MTADFPPCFVDLIHLKSTTFSDAIEPDEGSQMKGGR